MSNINKRKLPLPNYFQCPNLVIDELMPVLSTGAFKEYMFLIRHTVGMLNRESTEGIKQGKVIKGTGMSRTSVYRASKELKELGLIEILGDKKSGYEYVVFFDTVHNYHFKTFLMFQSETYKNYALMFQNETSYVSNWNILYILNTVLKDNNKKYIKNNPKSSAPKRENKKTPTKNKSDISDLITKETFEVFKSKFEFINFEDYKRLIVKLQELNKSVTKKRVTQNLLKLQDNKGRSSVTAFTSEQFVLSVDAFCKQEKYQGVWVVDVKGPGATASKNSADNLPEKKDENSMSENELDEELARLGVA